MRNSNQDPTAYSQERRQDDALSSTTKRSGESARSASTRKLERGDDFQIERTGLEFRNERISDHRHLEKVFKNLRQKLNLSHGLPTWKDMLKSASRDVVNWQIKRQSNCTQFQRLAWMLVRCMLSNCLENTCIRHELVDATFFGQ